MEESRDILGQIQGVFGKGKLEPKQYSALALAYIGDGVYDLIIRTIVVGSGNYRVNVLHRMTSGIVKAQSQAKLMKALEPLLSEEEQAVYRRGRNAKSGSSAKNASIVDYRIATGLEALIGFLYLSGRMGRALELVKEGLEANQLLPIINER